MMKKILLVLLAAMMIFSTVSCDLERIGSDSDIQYAAAKESRISIANNGGKGELIVSFKDEENWYYLFYLGQLRDVPLEEGEYWSYTYDGTEREKSFETSELTEETIVDRVNYASQICTSWKQEFEVTVGKEKNVKATLFEELLSVEQKKSIEAAYSQGRGGSTSDTWEESYEEGVKWSKAKKETTTFKFGADTPEGYYSYVAVGVIDVYALVMYTPSTNYFVIDNIEELVAKGHNLIYSAKDPTFEDIACEKLEFDISVLENPQEPTNGIEDVENMLPTDREIHIKSPEELIAALSGNTKGKTFVLDTEIDFRKSKQKWTPIKSFEGVLDGKGNIIKGIDYSFYDGADVDWGFFERIEEGAIVKNLVFDTCKAVYIAPSVGCAVTDVKFGFLASINYGTISNCEFISNVIDIDANTKVCSQYVQVGVAVCENYGTISDCLAQKNIVNIDVDTVSSDSADDKCAVAVAGGICAYNQRTGTVIGCQSENNKIHTRVCYLADEGEDVKAVSAGIIGFQYGNQNNEDPTTNDLSAIKRYYKAKWSIFGKFKGTEYEGEDKQYCGQNYTRS